MQHSEPQVILSHLLHLGVPAPTCFGGFILFGPNILGNLAVVLDHKKGLWAYFAHQYPGRGCC